MRSGKTITALAVSLALLTGCGPKQPKVSVSQAQAPSLPPAQMVALISPIPPLIPPTKRPVLKLDTTAPPDTHTETASTDTHRPPKHQHNKPVAPQETPSQEGTRVASAPATPAPQVPAAQPPEMSPIGQLSTTSDNTNNTADRHAISEQIDATENGLNGIKRSLSSDEQKTASQIRSYITRARDALKSDDLDGARTLSTKAHLLLIELTKQ